MDSVWNSSLTASCLDEADMEMNVPPPFSSTGRICRYEAADDTLRQDTGTSEYVRDYVDRGFIRGPTSRPSRRR